METKVLSKKYVEDNYVHKDRIRELIEALEKEVKQMEHNDIGIGFTLGKEWSDKKAKIVGYKELLNESEDK